MKTNLMMIMMSLTLLSTVSCGRAAKKAADNITKEMGKKVACSTADALAALPTGFAADYDIKLYQSTYEKVLSDIRPIKNLSPKDFWTSISLETRDVLNYELNLMLMKKRAPNAVAVYQSTAYFFSSIKDTFKENTDYKVRDAQGSIFSFVIRAQKTNQTVLMNYKCGRHERTDLSPIKLGKEVLQASEIKEIYECRTPKLGLILMEVRDTVLLKASETIHRFPLAKLEKDENKRKLEMEYKSADVDLKIKIKKKREETLEQWQGKKSKIELVTSEIMIDDDGACNNLLHAFED